MSLCSPLPCGDIPHGIHGYSYDVYLGLYQDSLVIAILSPWDIGRISSNLPQLTLELLLARWTDREGEPVPFSVLLTWVLRFPRRLHELSPFCVRSCVCSSCSSCSSSSPLPRSSIREDRANLEVPTFIIWYQKLGCHGFDPLSTPFTLSIFLFLRNSKIFTKNSHKGNSTDLSIC